MDTHVDTVLQKLRAWSSAWLREIGCMPLRLEAGAGLRDLPGPSDTTVRGRNTVDQPQLPW